MSMNYFQWNKENNEAIFSPGDLEQTKILSSLEVNLLTPEFDICGTVLNEL
ncbi:hypothetical protein [Bacillus sp. M6-12]|uniref:hypothetical protein n=1 Tax=Bacillus sp. M6-12 TaxID=2054166 RepID=UPI0015E0E0D7|nr:hypothetical protein [Bacillus sp. M6-12]